LSSLSCPQKISAYSIPIRREASVLYVIVFDLLFGFVRLPFSGVAVVAHPIPLSCNENVAVLDDRAFVGSEYTYISGLDVLPANSDELFIGLQCIS